MTEEQYNEISRRLDMLIRVTALAMVADKKQQDQIMALTSAGFQPKEIAEMLGTTRNTVSVTLSTMRRKKKET